jgi:hypothetical protein
VLFDPATPRKTAGSVSYGVIRCAILYCEFLTSHGESSLAGHGGSKPAVTRGVSLRFKLCSSGGQMFALDLRAQLGRPRIPANSALTHGNPNESGLLSTKTPMDVRAPRSYRAAPGALTTGRAATSRGGPQQVPCGFELQRWCIYGGQERW